MIASLKLDEVKLVILLSLVANDAGQKATRGWGSIHGDFVQQTGLNLTEDELKKEYARVVGSYKKKVKNERFNLIKLCMNYNCVMVQEIWIFSNVYSHFLAQLC